MFFLIFFIIGTFGAWYLTWGITSTQDIQGPFRLFEFVRWVSVQPFMPPLIRENHDCPYCVSFWAVFFVNLFLPIYGGLSWWDTLRQFFVVWLGMAGVIAFAFRVLQDFYGLDAKEF